MKQCVNEHHLEDKYTHTHTQQTTTITIVYARPGLINTSPPLPPLQTLPFSHENDFEIDFHVQMISGWGEPAFQATPSNPISPQGLAALQQLLVSRRQDMTVCSLEDGPQTALALVSHSPLGAHHLSWRQSRWGRATQYPPSVLSEGWVYLQVSSLQGAWESGRCCCSMCCATPSSSTLLK